VQNIHGVTVKTIDVLFLSDFVFYKKGGDY